MSAQPHRRRDSRSWKVRHKKAEEMFAAGESQASVARMLGVSRQCAHNWYWQWKGRDSAEAGERPPPGSARRSKMGADQLVAVDEALRRGPRSFGFQSERWTLWRIAAVIEHITGAAYHPSSVWRILRTLGWTLQLVSKTDRNNRAYNSREWVAPADQLAGRV